MRKLIVVFLLAAGSVLFGLDATQAAPQSQPPQPQKPFMAQLKETVVVIKLVCQVGQRPASYQGTGFFVSFPDARVGGAFSYLVTNRHVAECWDHAGKPMKVKSVGVRVNLTNGTSTVIDLNKDGNAPWVLPSSESVDLAVLPLALPTNMVELLNISTNDFATDDMFSSGKIHEGQSIIFTGFFPKIEGVQTMHPIVREGMISSLADEPVVAIREGGPAAKLYLGDVHVVAGNSGSPVMVDLAGRQGSLMILSESYKLIGVVNGYLTEDEDMSLKLETTVEATASANSGITTIIPVADLRALLNDDRLAKRRDAAAATFKSANPPK
jgi:hypothetical protein